MKPNTTYKFTLDKEQFYITDNNNPALRTYKYNLNNDIEYEFTTGA